MGIVGDLSCSWNLAHEKKDRMSSSNSGIAETAV